MSNTLQSIAVLEITANRVYIKIHDTMTGKHYTHSIKSSFPA